MRKLISYLRLIVLVVLSSNTLLSHAITLETVREPTEGAFRMDLPQGWQSQLGLQRKEGAAQTWVRALGPTQGNEWFVGDPNMAFFVDPSSMDPQMAHYLQMSGTPVSRTPRASDFVREYVQRRFGQVQILRTEEAAEIAAKVQREQQAKGRPVQVTAAVVEFQFPGARGPISGRVGASIMYMPGASMGVPAVWTPSVAGFVTTENFTQVKAAFERAEQSIQFDPQWQANEQQRMHQHNTMMAQRNAQRMQQSQAAHQQRMAGMQQNFQAHQNRMAQQSAQQDQQHAAYLQNSNAQYQSHQNYVRGAIRGQTVVGGPNGGPTYEVDAGSNYYYVDPYNNQYLGTEREIEPAYLPDHVQPMEEVD